MADGAEYEVAIEDAQESVRIAGRLQFKSDTAQPLGLAGGTVTGDVQFDGEVGFYATAPVAQPNVPLTTPDAQDIIDALVLLGLVEQSD